MQPHSSSLVVPLFLAATAVAIPVGAQGTGAKLLYGSFLGASGNSTDQLSSVDTDADGNVYMVGMTDGTDFPSTRTIGPGGGGGDAVVVKLTPDGRVVYSIRIGGSGFDGARAVAVRSDGTAYVVGETTSADFPVRDAFQPAFGGNSDVFVVELSPDGAAIPHATYLGGSDGDGPGGLELTQPLDDTVLDQARISIFDDLLFVFGTTKSPNFPTVNPTQSQRAGTTDAFLTVFDRKTLQPRFSSYAGLEGDNRADSLVINHKRGDAYLWLYRGDDPPVFTHFVPGPKASASDSYRPQKYTGEDYKNSSFLRYLDENGFSDELKQRLRYTAKSKSCSIPEGVTRDAQGRLHVKPGNAAKILCNDVFGGSLDAPFGRSASTAVQDDLRRSVMAVFAAGCVPAPPAASCTSRAYILFFDENLKQTAVLNVGGSGVGRNFVPSDMTVDEKGMIHLIGTTADMNLPVVSPVQGNHAGGGEGFILSIDPATNATTFFSYLGGSNFDTLTGIKADADGNLWIVGETLSSDFPVTRSGVQPEMRGRIDGFVVKITP